ncbi:hypothetical protein [Paenibacillus qinlingensis]|uniref:hypothetical protein n=1 Tax=Paenibacillus qinlingensis TaxID=1837343 RepID=UPI0015651968|nr:hypothetical protein [Paenibacillus qinlingensis]NQX59966.1 hypothetical protein [Paenibacillus qinlingensis]
MKVKLLKKKLAVSIVALTLLTSPFTSFTPIQSAAAATASVATTVKAGTSSVQAGQPIDFTLTSTAAVNKKLIFQFQVIGSNGVKVYEQILKDQVLPAGTPTSYPVQWKTPVSLPAGKYTISLGVFGAGYSESISWNWGLAPFEVKSSSGGNDAPDSAPVFTSMATVPATIPAGTPAALSATFTSDKKATANLNLAVFNVNNQKVYEENFTNVTYEPGVAKAQPLKWDVPADTASGSYTLQATLTGVDGAVYHKNTKLGTFTIKGDNPAATAVYTTLAVVDGTSTKAGNTASFTAKVTSSKTAAALVNVVIVDPYTGSPIFQKVFDKQALTENIAKEIPISWEVPANLATGTYPISIGIFGIGWEKQYAWNAKAGVINVNDGSVPEAQFTALSQVTPGSVEVGSKAKIQVAATSDINISGTVQAKIIDPKGTTVFAKEFSNETFYKQIAKTLATEWTPSNKAEIGTYKLELGIYNTEHTQTYYLNAVAAQFNVIPAPVVEPTPTPSPTPGGESPDNGSIAKWTLKAAVDPVLEAGYTATIMAEVGSDVDAKALVDVEVYKGNTKVYQYFVDNQIFKAGVTRQYPVTWNIPVSQERGDYTIRVAAFAPGWGSNWPSSWNGNATSFKISWGIIPDIIMKSTKKADIIRPSEKQVIDTQLTSSETALATVITELYDQVGNLVDRQEQKDVQFTKDVPNTYVTEWTASSSAVNGTYTLKVSVAKPDGVRVYYTNPEAVKFEVTGGITMEYILTATTVQPEVSAGKTLNVIAKVGSTVPSIVSIKVNFVDVLTGKTVHSEELRNQTISSDKPATLNMNWTLPKWIKMNPSSIKTKEDVIQYVLDGTYKVNVELYNPDMTHKIKSAEGATSFKVVSSVDASAPKPAKKPELAKTMKLGVFATNNDANGITGWMPQTGAPWDLAYRYLNGGVNSADGWRYWDQGNVGKWEGAYVYDYAKKATERGYTPVFTFYQMLQTISADCLKCGEVQDDLMTLNDPYAMRSYFEEFKLMMQLIGTGDYNGRQGIGKTAVVHIDPDLAGYAQQAVLDNKRCHNQCTGQGNNPAFLNAAVSSTRMPELEGLPDTYQGYNYALLRLRDLYAPNVLMAPHVNSWGTLTDVTKNTDPNLDVLGLAKKAGEFAVQNGFKDLPYGIQPYDYVLLDIDDNDSGAQSGPQLGNWLDRTNLTLPNFHRWEKFVKGVSDTIGKKIMVWQIPVGNQVYRTMNNTPGHWQDNKVEYFFSHLQELADSGIEGLMFGAGQPTSTAHYNKFKDAGEDENGVFNPAPLTNITAGWGDGSKHTNDKVANYSDDDGGLLREKAIEYYKNPLPLPVNK